MPNTFIGNTAAALNTLLDGSAPLLPIGVALFGAFAVMTIAAYGVSLQFGGDASLERGMRMAFKLTAVGALLTFWQIPLPWSSYSAAHLLPAEGAHLAQIFGAVGLTESGAALDEMFTRIEAPSVLTALGGVRTLFFWALFSTMIMATKAIMLAVVSWSMIALAVTLAFGPLIIPFAIVPRFDSMFYGWLRLLIVCALMPAVASAWALVSSRLLWATLNALPVGNWLDAPGTYAVISCTLLTCLVGSVGVPYLTGSIFSHAVHSSHGALAMFAGRMMR